MLKYCIVILIAFVVVKSDDECKPEAAVECAIKTMPDLRGLPEDNKFPDDKFLDEYCSPVITTLECISDVLVKCPDQPGDVRKASSLINGTLEFFHSVCHVDSELRKGYLENRECYNTVLPQIEECAEEAEQSVREFFANVENSLDPDEDRIAHICLIHSSVFGCAVLESTITCGLEETLPLETILDDISSLIKEANCPEEELFKWEARFALYKVETELMGLKKK